VITSATGAAIHDILNVLKRRFAALDILLYPVRVQGEGSALEIARAIDDMNRLGLVDVLIVGRGGGSLEDLWAFNEEAVARAVYRSKLPVISAVGHETDWTICDFVADLRAPTPSAAAELVIASSLELRAQLDALSHHLRMAMESRLTALDARVDALRRSLHDPSTMLGHLAQRMDDLTGRLELALENATLRRRELFVRLQSGLSYHNPARRTERLGQQLTTLSVQSERLILNKIQYLKHAFGGMAARLEVLSPLRTLSRGYAIAATSDGAVVTTVAQLAEGDRVKIQLYRGKAICRVEELEKP
ncbi:MAG: exodeoxyribonuclease VII large subunit, partial [Verrucomicrobia bacterium]|nr:exodeoxyribonuclease VII large subunit [Deltaproteobacteria bacterium]